VARGVNGDQAAQVTAGVPDVSVEQIHVGPLDDAIEHTMTAFCPCQPALEVGETDCARAQVVTYRHNQVGAE
jgi:hypothetical protein